MHVLVVLSDSDWIERLGSSNVWCRSYQFMFSYDLRI